MHEKTPHQYLGHLERVVHSESEYKLSYFIIIFVEF